MRVLYSFVGNICSGKTTIAKAVSEKFDIDFFSIDEYRIKHNARLITEEWAAWGDLTANISKCDIALLESSGLSQNVSNIYQLFDKVIIILIDCPENVLIERLSVRNKSDYPKVPFCWQRDRLPNQKDIKRFAKKINAIIPNYTYDSHNFSVNEIVEQIRIVIKNNEND